MRKLAASVLAVPVIALLYLPVLARRSIATRLAMALGVGSLIGLAAIGALAPRTVATPPRPIEPVPSAQFTIDLRTNHAPDGPVTIAFTTPMDEQSVAAALTVDPAAAVTLTWDSADRTLTVHPVTTWASGTYYTITVGTGALDKHRRPIAMPARAAFVVRPAAVANISVTKRVSGSGPLVPPDTAFVLSFDRPVDAESVRSAFRVSPVVGGAFDSTVPGTAVDRIVFTPTAPLGPGTHYTVSLTDGARDADGAPIDPPSPLTVETAPAPDVVRFRPVNGSTSVDRGAPLSVRFTAAMDRTSTAQAFAVQAATATVKGTISWAEGNTVLVFQPSKPLPAGAVIRMTVGAGATSAGGAAIASSQTGTFRTVAAAAPKPAPTKPVTKPVTKPTSKPVTRPIAKPSVGSAGGGAAAGAWTAVEEYYLRLMNCTRTGGWVTSSGNCSSPGGRDVAPLRLDPTISAEVSRPYAKLLATRGICSHWADGGPAQRLARAGFTSYKWAENVGCYPGNPMNSMIQVQLFFQSEKATNGGHYVNLMNALYDRVGIGVWVVGSTVRLVVDFYHP